MLRRKKRWFGLLLSAVVFCLTACSITASDPPVSQNGDAAEADTALSSESEGEL